MDERQATLWLSLCDPLHPKLRSMILTGNPIEKLHQFRKMGIRGPSTSLWRAAQDSSYVTYFEPQFPAALRELREPPLALYYSGKWERLGENPCVAIVGTRRASASGLAWAGRFARALAAADCEVISGLARGIDSAAHWASLEAKRGLCVAVLAHGLDLCYPEENQRLKNQIQRQGLLLSEYPPGCPAQKWHFPARNRIMAALAKKVLIIEAPLKSGSMLTAQHANDLAREIYVLPASIDNPNFSGNLSLIHQGAHLASSPQDLLIRLGRQPAAIRDAPPRNLEQWSAHLQLPIHQTLRQLTLWELDGSVIRQVDGRYRGHPL